MDPNLGGPVLGFRPLTGKQKLFQKEGRKIGSAFEMGLMINRLGLLAHGSFADVAKVRDFLKAQAFEQEKSDFFLRGGEIPQIELPLNLHSQSLEMFFGGCLPLDGLCSDLSEFLVQAGGLFFPEQCGAPNPEDSNQPHQYDRSFAQEMSEGCAGLKVADDIAARQKDDQG